VLAGAEISDIAMGVASKDFTKNHKIPLWEEFDLQGIHCLHVRIAILVIQQHNIKFLLDFCVEMPIHSQ
jgi:hypothetical protein